MARDASAEQGVARAAAPLAPDELLERMAVALRQTIAPAVGEPFAKTQAFMAAVILEKLSGQIRLADAHATADREERATLLDDLDAQVGASAPPRVGAALAGARAGDDAGLCALIEALYAERDALGPERFDALLSRVRRTLRARLDRQLAYAS